MGHIFLYFVVCLGTLLIGFFFLFLSRLEFLNSNVVQFTSVFSLFFSIFCVLYKKVFPYPQGHQIFWRYSPILSFRNLIILLFTFRTTVYMEFIFVSYGKCRGLLFLSGHLYIPASSVEKQSFAWHLCYKPSVHVCVSLFLGFVLYFLGVCVTTCLCYYHPVLILITLYLVDQVFQHFS